MSPLPFQLLELNVISAQDLSPVSKNLRTYAIAWINPERKLRTRVDQQGQINPTWNDKFVFRVDENFLNSETSYVMIEIYALGWLRDIPVGSVRVLISNLIPQNVRKNKNFSRRFVALQIRRPSGRPQGIFNMGVTLLDNNMKSMPLYTELSASAVGFQDLIGEKLQNKQQNHKLKNDNAGDDNTKEETTKKKNLRRTQSDCTDVKDMEDKLLCNNVNMPCDAPGGKGSMVNGSYCYYHGGSIVNGSEIGMAKFGSMCNSDVGPSASVVAAAVARGLYPTPLKKPHNPETTSILADWTADDGEDSNVEGLKSKIERWRMEIPGTNSMLGYKKISPKTSKGRKSQHARRHRGEERIRMFSCFGNAYGCEFTIVCGGDNGGSNRKGRSRSRSYNKKVGNSELDSQLVS